MSLYKLFPRFVASKCASLLFLFSLAIAFLAATPYECEAQSSSGRPVARLITGSRRPEQPRPQHHMAARPAVNLAPVAASSLERQAFDSINRERTKKGLSPLIWDGDLCRVARLHSMNMGRWNFFNHQGPDGTDVLDRLSGIMWKSVGENIAFNQGHNDPAGMAVVQWMNSPKHRENILRNGFTHSAIGIARTEDGRVYLTQVFIMR